MARESIVAAIAGQLARKRITRLWPRCGTAGRMMVRALAGTISVFATAGLAGGAMEGSATLSLQTSYRLPQTCGIDQVTKWNGGRWVCGIDENATGFATSLVGPSFTIGGTVATSYAPIGHIDLPPGKDAVFAKVNIDVGGLEDYSDTRCQLQADNDVDEGRVANNTGDRLLGEITLELTHEFPEGGTAVMQCTSVPPGFGPPEDFNGAAWDNLRITEIGLGRLESVAAP
jgi:hypothetical protein